MKLTKTEAAAKIEQLKILKEQETDLIAILEAPDEPIIEEPYMSIKTVEDACNTVKIDYEAFKSSLENLHEDTAAYEMLRIITEAINGESFEKWIDWDDDSQTKYYPWMDMRERSGSGFSYLNYLSTDTYSFVGSRLCLKSRDRLEYAVKTFLPIYETFFKK